MTTMIERYGDQAFEFAESLIGTCQLGTPDGSYYGIDQDDVWDVLGECDEVVFECASCGWFCDGSDRYFSEFYSEDICGQCAADEEYEDD